MARHARGRELVGVVLLLAGACAAPSTPYGYGRQPARAEPAPAASKAPSNDPVRERAAGLREAADLLDKAALARDRGTRSLAEQLFSSAELIVGVEALAELAGVFRAGAPPRVTTPLKVLPRDTPPQPIAVGSSDDLPPAPPPAATNEPAKPASRPRPVKVDRTTVLSGKLLVAGKAPAGELGMVSLTPAGGGQRPFPLTKLMEQRDRQFAPRLMVIPIGSLVTFANFDPTFHNVFSTSDTKAFDLGLYRNGEAREVIFDREGIVRVGCNLHSNMWATIVVVAAPRFTITDGAGRFELAGLEPGHNTHRAFSERSQKPVVRELEIKPGPNTVSVDAPADAPSGPMPDKFGVARGGK